MILWREWSGTRLWLWRKMTLGVFPGLGHTIESWLYLGNEYIQWWKRYYYYYFSILLAQTTILYFPWWDRVSSTGFCVTPNFPFLLQILFGKRHTSFMSLLSPLPPKKNHVGKGKKWNSYLKRTYVHLNRAIGRSSTICSVLERKQFISHSGQLALGFKGGKR